MCSKSDSVLFPIFVFSFMNSLGTMVSFFSQKVKKKVTLIQELSLKHAAEADGKNNAQHSALQKVSSSGLNRGVSVGVVENSLTLCSNV